MANSPSTTTTMSLLAGLLHAQALETSSTYKSAYAARSSPLNASGVEKVVSSLNHIPPTERTISALFHHQALETSSTYTKCYGPTGDSHVSRLARHAMVGKCSLLRTQLLEYQLQGLLWMNKAENRKWPTADCPVSGLWKYIRPNLYMNMVTGAYDSDLSSGFDKPPLEPAKGGVLADAVGMGKSLHSEW